VHLHFDEHGHLRASTPRSWAVPPLHSATKALSANEGVPLAAAARNARRAKEQDLRNQKAQVRASLRPVRRIGYAAVESHGGELRQKQQEQLFFPLDFQTVVPPDLLAAAEQELNRLARRQTEPRANRDELGPYMGRERIVYQELFARYNLRVSVDSPDHMLRATWLRFVADLGVLNQRVLLQDAGRIFDRFAEVWSMAALLTLPRFLMCVQALLRHIERVDTDCPLPVDFASYALQKCNSKGPPVPKEFVDQIRTKRELATEDLWTQRLGRRPKHRPEEQEQGLGSEQARASQLFRESNMYHIIRRFRKPKLAHSSDSSDDDFDPLMATPGKGPKKPMDFDALRSQSKAPGSAVPRLTLLTRSAAKQLPTDVQVDPIVTVNPVPVQTQDPWWQARPWARLRVLDALLEPEVFTTLLESEYALRLIFEKYAVGRALPQTAACIAAPTKRMSRQSKTRAKGPRNPSLESPRRKGAKAAAKPARQRSQPSSRKAEPAPTPEDSEQDDRPLLTHGDWTQFVKDFGLYGHMQGSQCRDGLWFDVVQRAGPRHLAFDGFLEAVARMGLGYCLLDGTALQQRAPAKLAAYWTVAWLRQESLRLGAVSLDAWLSRRVAAWEPYEFELRFTDLIA